MPCFFLSGDTSLHQSWLRIYPAESIYFKFHPLEIVSRYRDPQLQVAGNYSYLLNLRTNINKSCCLHSHFSLNSSGLIGWLKGFKTTIVVISTQRDNLVYDHVWLPHITQGVLHHRVCDDVGDVRDHQSLLSGNYYYFSRYPSSSGNIKSSCIRIYYSSSVMNS